MNPYREQPTQGDAQGEDQGTQYRSGIYYCCEDQRLMAMASQRAYQAALLGARHQRPITTEIEELCEFFFAEDYHRETLPGIWNAVSPSPSARTHALPLL